MAGFTFVRLVSRMGVSHTNSHKARLEDECGSRLGGGKQEHLLWVEMRAATLLQPSAACGHLRQVVRFFKKLLGI